MIYTLTFNPALDYVMFMDQDPLSGQTNRSRAEAIYYGGKGINVSMVLKALGLDSTALGFIAGFTGKAIEDGLHAKGIRTDFIKLPAGNSRINIKLKSQSETEINAQGPDIPDTSIAALFDKLKMLNDGDTLILAGSIPSSLEDNTYELIIKSLKDKKVRLVIDASGDLLLNILPYRPFLIKPNLDELEEIFKIKIQTDDEIVKYASQLRSRGAFNVLVSLAGRGAILLTQNDQIIKIDACKGHVKNSVGAGDSMVAGFLYGYFTYGNFEDALKMGTAAGCASAFSENLASRALIETLYKDLKQA